jgi:hypothetical protein
MRSAPSVRIGSVQSGAAGKLRTMSLAVVAYLCILAPCGGARAQSAPEIAVKSGESVELGTAYFVSACRSVLVAPPTVEVLEGPPELTLVVKPGDVLPRRQNCPNKVAGGIVVATAKDVKEPINTKLTYRVIYKTKDGDRQVAHTYNISLFP